MKFIPVVSFLILICGINYGAVSPEQGYVVSTPFDSGSRCSQIEAVDFKNYSFIVRDPQESGPHQLPLRNGVYSDEHYGGTDWQSTLESDSKLVLPEGERFRLLQLLSNHLMGSGSVTRVFLFVCRRGLLTELLQAGGEGMKARWLSAGRLQLTFAVWEENDAHCCPSNQKIRVFRWHSTTRSFMLESEKKVPLHPRGPA
jgi:hypothetical protein